ncbi:hypothetical protein JCM8547_006149 [Rhodosporidiobolus lusitaniae]
MSSYGTRRNSHVQLAPSPSPSIAPIGLPPTPYSPSLTLSPALSSSVGKSKRPSTITKARRLSSTAHTRPATSNLSASMPNGLGLHLGRGRSTSVSQTIPDGVEDDGVPAQGKGKARKETFECEKCSKVYRHSTCLTKHRWHWNAASKLLLSKHQQVQLLEGAAILAAASAGTSLPEEKSYWPAAVSPPASGLLGSSEFGINIHALSASGPGGFGSPRFAPSSLYSDAGDFDASRSEVSIDEDSPEDDEDDGQSPPRAGSVDEDDQLMEDGMFDLDLGGSGELPPASPLPHVPLRLPTLNDRGASPSTSDGSSPGPVTRPGIPHSSDSGFGSLGRTNTIKRPSPAATAAAVAAANILASPRSTQQPVMGFFVPQPAPQ